MFSFRDRIEDPIQQKLQKLVNILDAPNDSKPREVRKNHSNNYIISYDTNNKGLADAYKLFEILKEAGLASGEMQNYGNLDSLTREMCGNKLQPAVVFCSNITLTRGRDEEYGKFNLDFIATMPKEEAIAGLDAAIRKIDEKHMSRSGRTR